MENLLIQFLESFFQLFNAEIYQYKIENNKIIGVIMWPDENEKQDFCWNIERRDINFSKLTFLCRFLKSNFLIHGDKIIISYKNLIEELNKQGWNKEEAKIYVDFLSSFEIKMIDDGEETDSFFLHF